MNIEFRIGLTYIRSKLEWYRDLVIEIDSKQFYLDSFIDAKKEDRLEYLSEIAEHILMEKNAQQLNNLAIIYQLNQKYNDARKIYWLAIKQMDNKAIFNLALMNQFLGNRVEEMKGLYKIAISNGNTSAMCNLGNYYRGKNLTTKSMKLLVMAAEAQCSEALRYWMTNTLNFHLDNILYMFHDMADNGNLKVITDLCYFYSKIPVDSQVSWFTQSRVKYLQMGVEENDPECFRLIADFYSEENFITAKKFINAEECYIEAIYLGNIKALERLADFYSSKKCWQLISTKSYQEYITENSDTIIKLYQKAIKKGNLEESDCAALSLAHFYSDIMDNNDEAEKIYLNLIEKGNILAMDEMRQHLCLIKSDRAEKYTKMAIDHGCYNAIISEISRLGKELIVSKGFDDWSSIKSHNEPIFNKIMELCCTKGIKSEFSMLLKEFTYIIERKGLAFQYPLRNKYSHSFDTDKLLYLDQDITYFNPIKVAYIWFKSKHDSENTKLFQAKLLLKYQEKMEFIENIEDNDFDKYLRLLWKCVSYSCIISLDKLFAFDSIIIIESMLKNWDTLSDLDEKTRNKIIDCCKYHPNGSAIHSLHEHFNFMCRKSD